MRTGKSSTEKFKFHCETCGQDWESTVYEDERNDGSIGERPDNPHECKLLHGRFFLREENEYHYKEGVLYTREVMFAKYSGHDILGEGDGPNRTAWRRVYGELDGVTGSGGPFIPKY